MNSAVKHIIGWVLITIFVMNGIASAVPALIKFSTRQDVAQLVETSENTEERTGEREIARDFNHQLDIQLNYIARAHELTADIYNSDNWPAVYLPVFTPPPEW